MPEQGGFVWSVILLADVAANPFGRDFVKVLLRAVDVVSLEPKA